MKPRDTAAEEMDENERGFDTCAMALCKLRNYGYRHEEQ